MTHCIVRCPPCHRPAVATSSKRPDAKASLCAMHFHYFTVVLADPWYRNHEPPDPEAPQLMLRLGESL